MNHLPYQDYQIINQWIRNGEGHKMDFKTNISSSPKIAKNITAFANSLGGRIVIGVEDKGAVIGVDAVQEKFAIQKAAEEYCKPSIPLIFSKLKYGHKYILVAEIKESINKPHFAINEKGEQTLYVRIGDKCVAPPAIIRNFLLAGQLNNLMRSSNFKNTMKADTEWITARKEVSLSEFATQHNLSEKDALRRLIDYTLDGGIRIINEQLPSFG